ncbi:MAG: DUF1294 domain-containing protein [Polyangiales bacterium]
MVESILPPLSLLALVYNALVALVFAYDKRQARLDRRRVPERTLMTLAAAFGAIGALVGMRLARHKTRKPLFSVGVPVLVLAQVGLLAYAMAPR